MNEKRPVKSKRLKVIDQLGTLYATFDGQRFWKLDRMVFKLLTECDGSKTFDEIAQKVSSKSGLSLEDVKIGLKPIFEELERVGFIEFI